MTGQERVGCQRQKTKKKKVDKKKDRVYFEISMIRQIPLNMPESNQLSLAPPTGSSSHVFFSLLFLLWLLRHRCRPSLSIHGLFFLPSLVLVFREDSSNCGFRSLSAGEMIDGRCTLFGSFLESRREIMQTIGRGNIGNSVKAKKTSYP